ncbi:MAG: signal peptidase I [Bacteroidales bacterium]|nr:signal peptidase I [Bacteroidales bacterium]
MRILQGIKIKAMVDNKSLKMILLLFLNIPLFLLVWYFLRIAVFDYYTIPSESMYPTLAPGDKVVVNKLLMGGRIYKNFHFNKRGQELQSWRIRGLRSIEHNDICVFNYPVHFDEISFVINHLLCKRCIALPGDSLRIIDGRYVSNQSNVKLNVKRIIDSDSLSTTIKTIGDELGWTTLHFGPMYIPRQGDEINITPREAILYNQILQWELDKTIAWDTISGVVTADNVPLTKHVWKHNYYFMAGDNIDHSSDSRYWGLVPEEYVVGIVKLIIHKGRLIFVE